MRHEWSEFRRVTEDGGVSYDGEAVKALLDAEIPDTLSVVEIDGTLERPYLSKNAAFYGPHDRLVGIDVTRSRWKVLVEAHYVREAFFQGVDSAIRVYQNVTTRHGATGYYGIYVGQFLWFACRADEYAGVSYIGPVVASAVEWGSSNLPPFTVSSRAPMTVANNMATFYESGDALYSMESFGTTYRNAFNPHATGGDPLVVYDRVDFGTSVYDPGIPDYLARQFVYEPLGDGARVARGLELIDTHGTSLRLFRDRTRLYAQRVGTPYLQFIRHYDGADDVVLDVSSANHMFVVDGKGSPGESGFGDSEVATLMSSNQADAVDRVEALRDEATGRVKYRVYRKKRYPQ
jgi:hypothetical protein